MKNQATKERSVAKKDDVCFTKSSGNVFADLGLPNPEERLLKAELAMSLKDLIAEKRLSQTEAGERIGLAQPHISNIINGRLSGYSVERLMQAINALGRRVEVRIGAKDVAQDKARTVVKAL